MSEQFSNLSLPGLKICLSFIYSHPLYLCYLIFFSPYLFKLFSFLSPLFITTSLLLLGLLTVCPQSQSDFILSAYQALKEKLCLKTDAQEDDFCKFEDLEVYKIVFDTSALYQVENSAEDSVLGSKKTQYESSSRKNTAMGVIEDLDHSLDEKTVEVDWEESPKPVIEDQNLEEFLDPLEHFESMPCYVDEKQTDLHSVDPDDFEVKREVVLKKSESEKIVSKTTDDIVKCGSFWDSPSSRAFDSTLGSYGSMRREKEWTRTLACKLFEERSRGDGEEGMDMLWEAYENNSSNKGKKTKNNMKNDKNLKKTDSEFHEDDCEENEVVGVQLCCLQALQFSTTKINMGMGRTNVVKISKTMKGFGWLRNITRHSKRSRTSNKVIN